MLFVIDRSGFIFSSGRDISYFSRNVHHMVISEQDLLSGSSQERLLQIYNRNAEIPLIDFNNIDDARERVASLLTNFKLEEIPMAKRNKENASAEAGTENLATAEATKSAVSKSRTPKSAVIRLKTDKNPKREGSASHTRFALYQDGQTVGEFLEAGGSMGDINFDQNKGFIHLEGVDVPEVAAAAE